MPKHLTPEALLEIAKAKRAEERSAREAEREARETKSRQLAREEKLWTQQAHLLLGAAVSGKSSTTVERPLVRPSELLELDLSIETLIRRPEVDETTKRELAAQRSSAASDVRRAVAAWVDRICRDNDELRPHKHEILEEAGELLVRAMRSEQTTSAAEIFFSRGSDFFEQYVSDWLEEYEDEVDRIELALERWLAAATAENEAADEDDGPTFEQIEDAEGLASALPPFRFSWGKVTDPQQPWDGRAAISEKGLAWISGAPGQRLLRAIDAALEHVATSRKRMLQLELPYSNVYCNYWESEYESAVVLAPDGESLKQMLSALGWDASFEPTERDGYSLCIRW